MYLIYTNIVVGIILPTSPPVPMPFPSLSPVSGGRVGGVGVTETNATRKGEIL